ncbi:MAG: putative addiction module antidote protein [Burkholderiaceae bacterium]|nr:putative addiction module antidote protein [Burkholderiaceae bacterium]
MNRKIKISELAPFDLAEYLQDEADLVEYLNQVVADGDAGELAHALGVVAKARGMAQMAEAAGIGREALYKALRPGSQPRFDTIARVCAALGLRLTVQSAVQAD